MSMTTDEMIAKLESVVAELDERAETIKKAQGGVKKYVQIIDTAYTIEHAIRLLKGLPE